MPRYKFNTSCGGPDGNFSRGQEVDLTEDQASQFGALVDPVDEQTEQPAKKAPAKKAAKSK